VVLPARPGVRGQLNTGDGAEPRWQGRTVPATQDGDTGFHKGRSSKGRTHEHRALHNHDAREGAGPRLV